MTRGYAIKITQSTFNRLTLVPRPDGQDGEWRISIGSDEGGSTYAVPGESAVVCFADDVHGEFYLVEVE